ncbi:MAG: FkbM family methyltransferase [Candidatus Bathyarchaeota archaeon]|nr:FkbM family methyltransferase [Candidatus Bathyarchaeota archaeon]
MNRQLETFQKKTGIDLESNTYKSKIRRATTTIRSKGLVYYAHNYCYKLLNKTFSFKENHMPITSPTWREVNFKALHLNASAKLLLNPSDAGFSKEFNAYGFREPLNTITIFNYVAKKKPVILDIGGNLGYFPLVELEAGAEKVIVAEPIPSTFALLSKTLARFKRIVLLNIAISNEAGFLTLYVAAERNVTSSSKSLLTSAGHIFSGEINVKADTLSGLADTYPFNMIRMDVEGHEYQILDESIPDQIEAINVELHVLYPYDKSQAIKLLQNLFDQSFKVTHAIKEMGYGYYQMIQNFGLKTAYKLATAVIPHARACPWIRTNPSLDELISEIPERGQIHLLLQR